MSLDRVLLRKMIISEMKIISEDCGCGCNGSPGGCGGDISDEDSYLDYEEDSETLHASDVTTEDQFMTKGESLKAVVAIALSTTCPVTRDALLSTVEDIM